MSFFREMRRRSVYRVGAAYVIVGWLIIQIAVNVFPQLQLPEWTVTLITVLVAMGFPVALLLAWAFELTPDGVRPSRSADDGTPVGAGKPLLDYALVTGLVLVAGALLVSSFRSDSRGVAVSESADTVLIAIMPFEDQSPDGDYGWLGQGIPSELRNGLGRVAEIEIAPPSFGFSFDDSDAVAVIDYVVEGSIRSDGETLRVSASLTNVKERRNDPLLQENYPASEAFTIQEDLATRILSLIGVRLGVQDVNAFAGAGTTDRDAYENYLRGISVLGGPAASEFLREAVLIDPLYANAWAQLALISTAQKWVAEQPSQMLPFTAQGLEYALRARDLQPESAEVLSMLGTMYYGSNDWVQGHEYHLSALSIKRNPIALRQSGMLLHRAGNSSEALRRVDEAAEFSSLQVSGVSPFQRAVMLIQLRRYGEAREMFREMSLEERLDAELMLNLSAGTREDVRQSIAAMVSQSVAGLRNAERGEAASRLYTPLLAVFDDPSAALSLLRELHADEESWPSKWHDIGRLAAWFGDTEFAFELVAEEARNGSPRRYGLWMPYMAEVRALPEFEELVEEINLVEFWERYGWGDFCRGSAAEFSCD